MALVASGVHNEVANHRMTWKRLDTNSAAVLGQIPDLGGVGQDDTPVDANPRRGRSSSPTAPEGKASVNIALHGDQKVLNGCVSGNSAGQGVPTRFCGLGAIAEDFQRDGHLILCDDTRGEVAFDNIVVITGTVGLHLFKEFNLKCSRLINAGEDWKGFFNPNFPGRLEVNIAFLNGVGFSTAKSGKFVVPIVASLAVLVVRGIADGTN